MSKSPECGCGFVAKSPAGLAAHKRACKWKPDTSLSVEQAVRRETSGRGDGGLVASALVLARAMDETTSPRDLAPLARELRSVLSEIAGVTEEADEDVVDDLAARRAARRAAAAGKSRPASG